MSGMATAKLEREPLAWQVLPARGLNRGMSLIRLKRGLLQLLSA